MRELIFLATKGKGGAKAIVCQFGAAAAAAASEMMNEQVVLDLRNVAAASTRCCGLVLIAAA